MSGHPAKPLALAFDDTGALSATGGGAAATACSCRGRGPEGTLPGVLKSQVQPVTTLAFAPGAMRLASRGRDGAVVVWSLQRNGRGGPIGAEDLEASVTGLYWLPNGAGLRPSTLGVA